MELPIGKINIFKAKAEVPRVPRTPEPALTQHLASLLEINHPFQQGKFIEKLGELADTFGLDEKDVKCGGFNQSLGLKDGRKLPPCLFIPQQPNPPDYTRFQDWMCRLYATLKRKTPKPDELLKKMCEIYAELRKQGIK